MTFPPSDSVDQPSQKDSADDDQGRSRWSVVTLILSIVFIAAIAVGGVLSWVSLQKGNDPGEDVPSPHSAPATPPGSAQAEPHEGTDLDELFNTPTTDIRGRRLDVPKQQLGQVLPQSSPTESRDSSTDPPEGLMWQKVFGLPMPFSTSDGPTHISELGTPSGFSERPQGAILAAWQFAYRLAGGSQALRAELLDTAIVSDEPEHRQSQRDSYLSLPDHLGPDELAMFNDIPKAVQMVAFSDDLATIRFGFPLVGEDVDPADQAGAFQTLTVVRTDGEWKLALKGPKGQADWGRAITFEGWSQW